LEAVQWQFRAQREKGAPSPAKAAECVAAGRRETRPNRAIQLVGRLAAGSRRTCDLPQQHEILVHLRDAEAAVNRRGTPLWPAPRGNWFTKEQETVNFSTTVLTAAACFLAMAGDCCTAGKPNVLFIAVDDLRPELGCYGSPIAITPNLDGLAKDGLLFNRAYCQEAICRPSRASLMTGVRPDTTGLTHNYVALRELAPNILTLPQHFIAHGYETVYLGKVFHHGDTDDENSWSRKPVRRIPGVSRPVGGYALPGNRAMQRENLQRMLAKYGEAARRGLGSGPAYESADVPDHAYIDGYNTQLAMATMKEMVQRDDQPFFLALGFFKPHLNWVAPQKYWDLYDRAKLPLAEQTEGPLGGAAMGLHASFELRTRAGIPKIGPLGPELSRTLKHAYLACVSYIDAQIGRMLTALDETDVREAQQKDTWDRDLFENRLMGYAMRTDRYRLVVWQDTARPAGEPIFVELYDHRADPAETVNVAKQQPEVVAKLLTQFHAGWKGSLP
jgi:iduronate 2-sulfatase